MNQNLRKYLWILLLIAAGVAEAQIVKSTVVGTVRDFSDAVVSNAKVSVANLETGVVTSTSTDASGNYVVPFLNSGTYTVTVESSRFKTAVQSAFNLDVAAKVRVDFKLEIGQVNEKVEVSTVAPLVETDTTTVGLVVTTEKLSQLPLLGRNYQALTQLAPTAISLNLTTNVVPNYQPGLSVGNYYQVAGQRGGYIAYTIDGINANQLFFQTESVIPSLDTIQEFKVQFHNFAAEYGRGTVQSTSTTKNGTNELHGAAYEYVQNDILNANDYFSNRAGLPKAKFRYNQFGATVGGPIFIPKIYNGRNKSFFFFGYEGTRYRQAETGYGRFPDSAWLQGNFSDLTNPDGSPRLIYDPATTRSDGNGGFIRDPFPGNIIPQDRFNSVSAALFPFIPAPNATSGNLPGNANAVGPTGRSSNVNYWTVRIDHRFSPSDAIYGRYMQSVEDLLSKSLVPLSGASNANHGRNAMLSEVHVFSPRIVNEFRFGYNRNFYGAFQQGAYGSTNYVQDVFKLKNVGGSGPITYGIPDFSWVGYSQVGGPVDSPFLALTNTWQLSDNLSWTFGHHAVKAGFDIQRQRFNPFFSSFNRGYFGFSGQFSQFPGNVASGSPFADYLLGISNDVRGLSGTSSGAFHGPIQGYYVQDDWRVSSKLTLNLGLRYENYSPWSEETGAASTFQFGSPVGTCFGVNCPPGRLVLASPGKPFYDSNPYDFAPRVGLAYSPFGNNKTVIRAAYGIFYTPPDAVDLATSVFNPPQALNFFLFPENPITDLTTTNLSNQFPAGSVNRSTPLVTDNWPLPAISIFTVLKHLPDGIDHNWQLTVQRELTHNLLLEVGYIGSHGYNGQRRVDYNQARLDFPGELTSITSRLPYPSLSPLMFVNEHSGYSIYQAGTLRLERRFEGGFSLVGAYTFAKTIDDQGNLNDGTGFWAQNAYDKKAERGLSSFDVRHRLTAGYVYEFPIGRGKRFGANMNPILNGIVGGWQLSGITTFQAGAPLLVQNSGGDNSNTGQIQERSNQVGPVHYLNPRTHNLQWYDPSAFTDNALGTFGNARRGAIIGPGINNWDMSFAKKFALTEKAKVQFRAETFNTFNHAQFQGVNTTLLQPSTGFVYSTRPPRNIQLALRLEF